MRKNIAQIGFCLLLVSSFARMASAGEEIIMDNDEAKFKGSWGSSTALNQKYKKDYRFYSSTDTSEPSATAEYHPTIGVAGRYDVDIWYTSGENRSTTAPVTISCRSGMQTYKIDQKTMGGRWVPVAKGLEFDLGNSGFIIIGNNTGSTGSVVVADAIRLTQVGGGDGPAGYSLKISSALTGGSITKNPNRSGFTPGDSVQITAVADEGFVFSGWTGDASGMANPFELTMDKDKTVGANFVQGGVGVIVESDEAVYEGDGDWQTGSKKWNKPHAETFRWTSGGKDTGKKLTATYTPNIPKSGLYDIYLWNVPGTNRSETTPVEISCKSGNEVMKINQKAGPSDWMLVATAREFEAGKNSYVRINNYQMNESSAVVAADAVAFVFVGNNAGSQSAKR